MLETETGLFLQLIKIIGKMTTGIMGYVYESENKQIVFSQLWWPRDRSDCKSDRDYKKGIEVWEKSFINVLNARPITGKEPGTNILISNSKKDDSLILEHGNKCLVSLKKKGVLVLCACCFGSWTVGYGVFGETPEKAINFYKKYVEWLKIRKPGDFPPAHE